MAEFSAFFRPLNVAYEEGGMPDVVSTDAGPLHQLP
jgi:hypothetical protein